MTTSSSRNSTAFNTTTHAVRGSFLGLALVVTFSLLASVSGMADQQYDKARVAQASTSPTQVVLITGQHIARS
jgi:hypothetical protein